MRHLEAGEGGEGGGGGGGGREGGGRHLVIEEHVVRGEDAQEETRAQGGGEGGLGEELRGGCKKGGQGHPAT